MDSSFLCSSFFRCLNLHLISLADVGAELILKEEAREIEEREIARNLFFMNYTCVLNKVVSFDGKTELDFWMSEEMHFEVMMSFFKGCDFCLQMEIG